MCEGAQKEDIFFFVRFFFVTTGKQDEHESVTDSDGLTQTA